MIRQIRLPFKLKRPVLACGADLKGAFALARGREAFLIDGFGDLSDPDNFAEYERAVKKYQKRLGIKPQIIACDLHPGYFSTRLAHEYTKYDIRNTIYEIQHHEAHIASAIVDNDIKGKVIGIAFDGTGYGSDGNIWGGEFFTGGLKKFKRAAHLEYIPMPGGEMAIKEPWRMAVSYLYHSFGKIDAAPILKKRWREKDVAVMKAMIDKKINSPLTSSVGRLFDAVGSLVLAKDRVSKEAELPIELEGLVSGTGCGSYKFDIRPGCEGLIAETGGIIRDIVKDLSGKIDTAVISRKFHDTIADLILGVSSKLRKKFKLRQVVLSGGVFQNKYLAARAAEILRASKFKVYIHSGIPTNDSGIPIGQIAIAGLSSIKREGIYA
jgi:hydrogenase maturation protein HypF